MVICPWCGTGYLTFQSNCQNCGGILPAIDEKLGLSAPTENLATPPSAPRPISEQYVWRLLFTKGWAITALVFGLLGVIFSLVGAALTLGVITAFVGIPFLLFGLGFLGAGGGISLWQYHQAQQIVRVLREGTATRGKIIQAQENYHTRINGRYPWVIRYQFQANGQSYAGTVTTLNPSGQQLQAGQAVSVLYLPTAPQWNSIYPHP